MTATEFQIEVGREKVEGRCGRPGTRLELVGSFDVNPDALVKETVGLMDRWLNYWQLLTDAELRQGATLLQPTTFEVMGKLLWRLILDNDIGRALLERMRDRNSQPLRLLLALSNDADTTLRGLPWEFLYTPEGEFLAAKTGMLLTRYVPVAAGRPKVTAVGNDQLRVLLVAALPDGRRFAWEREQLGKLEAGLKSNSGLDVLTRIEHWDEDLVAQMMRDPAKPVHVVHVVGICRGEPGAPRIFTGAAGDPFGAPLQLLNALTGPGTVLPRLVVLQLCEDVDGDSSENFERLAPALIERSVPAVLALQYAETPEGGGVGTEFYNALLSGKRVGTAVQETRGRLSEDGPSRRLGTPVLYLGDDGYLKRRPRPHKEPSGAVLARGTGAAPMTERQVREVLAKVVKRAELGDERQRELLKWVKNLDLAGNPVEAAREHLKSARRAPNDSAMAALLVEMISALPKRDRNPDHGQ